MFGFVIGSDLFIDWHYYDEFLYFQQKTRYVPLLPDWYGITFCGKRGKNLAL